MTRAAPTPMTSAHTTRRSSARCTAAGPSSTAVTSANVRPLADRPSTSSDLPDTATVRDTLPPSVIPATPGRLRGGHRPLLGAVQAVLAEVDHIHTLLPQDVGQPAQPELGTGRLILELPRQHVGLVGQVGAGHIGGHGPDQRGADHAGDRGHRHRHPDHQQHDLGGQGHPPGRGERRRRRQRISRLRPHTRLPARCGSGCRHPAWPAGPRCGRRPCAARRPPRSPRPRTARTADRTPGGGASSGT